MSQNEHLSILGFCRGQGGVVQFLLNPSDPENLSLSIESTPPLSRGERARDQLDAILVRPATQFNFTEHPELKLKATPQRQETKIALAEINERIDSQTHHWYTLKSASDLLSKDKDVSSTRLALVLAVQVIARTESEFIQVDS